MSVHNSMRTSAARFLRPGEHLVTVIGAQTASQYLAAMSGFLLFPLINRYRILAITPERILVLDAGRMSMKKARGVVTELPRSTRFAPGTGNWHRMRVGTERLRVHRRFFRDMRSADLVLQPS